MNETDLPAKEPTSPASVDEVRVIFEKGLVKNPLIRKLLVLAGCISLGLGILGIPLPVLPTTPFLLLSAYCFGRSSRSLLNWLLTNRAFGNYLCAYCSNRGIPRRVKVYILVLLWGTILLSAFVAISLWWLRILLLLIACGVSWHVLRMKTSD